jgi:hypothetical protein
VISEAYQVLSKERKEYDNNLWRYQKMGQLDPLAWGEEFAANGSGTDSGKSDSVDSDSEKHKKHKPDKFRMDIYKEATPYVHNLLEDPDDFASDSQIRSLNRRITEQNMKEGFERDEFHISHRFLRAFGLSTRDALATLERDPDDRKAKTELKKLENQLEKWVRVNSYPPEWLGSLNGNLRKGGSSGKNNAETLAEQMLAEWIEDSKQVTKRLIVGLKEAVNAANLTNKSLKLPFRNQIL